MITRYPLCWPAGWKRTQSSLRRRAAFNRKELVKSSHVPPGQQPSFRQQTKQLSISDSVDRVLSELTRLGVENVREDATISTNLQTNIEGRPRGDRGEPSDPGVAVYWERDGVRQCMAIDQYDRVADNLAAISATLEAMRAIERHGGAEILNRAFTGFAALPEKASSTWRAALGFKDNQQVTLAEAESAFRDLAKTLHPDQGGNDTLMRGLLEARAAAKLELSAKEQQ